MAGRYGGRFGTNQEQEQRRIQKEPVVIWKQEWVLPAGAPTNSTVKILKWVRTGAVINFDEEEGVVGEESMAMEVDINASTLLDPMQTAPTMDNIAATPIPEIPASASILPAESMEDQQTTEPTTALDPLTTNDLDKDASTNPAIEAEAGAEAEAETDTVFEASQPPYTQPSVVSSQDPLTGTQELLDSSQSFEGLVNQ